MSPNDLMVAIKEASQDLQEAVQTMNREVSQLISERSATDRVR